jgi:carbon storage regulator CsrA
MLVLSRKLNQEIVIDGNIRIRVVHVGEGKVRIGVDAPVTVGIRRGELSDRAALEPTPEPIAAEIAARLREPASPSPVSDCLSAVVATWGPGPCILPLLDLNRLPGLRRPR